MINLVELFVNIIEVLIINEFDGVNDRNDNWDNEMNLLEKLRLIYDN